METSRGLHAGSRIAGTALAPARPETMRNAELIENAGDDEIDEVVDRLRAIIKSRNRRNDRGAGACQLQHVLEMNRGARRFTGDEDERTPFLQHDVGGALDQVVRKPAGDRSDRAHRAWA